MTALDAFKMYVAFRIHFMENRKNFDIKENRYGQYLKIPQRAFEQRRDVLQFKVLSKFFTFKQLFTYYASNFIYGNPNQMIFDMSGGMKNYNRFVGNIEGLTYLLKRDLNTLSRNVSYDYLSSSFVTSFYKKDSKRDLVDLTEAIRDGNIWLKDPICIFNMWKCGLVNIETLIAMDKTSRIVDYFRRYTEMSVICEPDFQLIRKSTPFFRLTEESKEMLKTFLKF